MGESMIQRRIFTALFLLTSVYFAQATVVFDSVAEYSTVQGSTNWYYGYYDGDSAEPYTTSDFEEFPQLTAGGGWIIHRGDPSGYWTSMGRYGGHPNGPVANYYQGTEHWTVRRWISDTAGTVLIEGYSSKSSSYGDGTICSITVNDSLVYSKRIYGTEGGAVDYSIQVDINVGDVIDFAIQPVHNDLYDSTRFTAVGTLLSTVDTPIIGIAQSLNIDDCIEATSPEGALVSAYVANFMDDTNLVYSWSTEAGQTGTGPAFDFQLGLNQSTIVFLTVTDRETGDEASSFELIRVSDTTGPQIEILDPVNGDWINSNSLFLNVCILDMVDMDIEDYSVSMGGSSICPLDTETGESRIHLLKPAPGGTVPMDITVTAQDASGNTSQATVQVMLQHDNRNQ